MFKIGDFAKLNKLSVKTLRYYDELGLLKPIKVVDQSGYRYYSARQIPRLNRILALKDLGFSLNKIAEIIDSDLGTDVVLKLLDEKKAEVLHSIQCEQDRLIKLERIIGRIKEDDSFMLNYDVILKQTDSQKMAALRDIIEDYSKQHYLWQELITHLNRQNAKIAGPCIATYYDNGYKESDVDIEVMQCIARDIRETDRIKIKELPAVDTAACVIHKGKYEAVGLAYNVIAKWIEENGYRVAGPNRELYFEGEWSTDNPDEYITEIQIPVEKNAGEEGLS